MTAQPSEPLAGDPVPAGDPAGADGIAVPRVRSHAGSRPSTSATTASSSSPSRSSSTSTVASPDFLTWQNLLNLVFQNATLGIAACAVTYTIIAGNFDLSLGAIFVLSEVLGA